MKFDRLLVPVDFSPDSRQALLYAVALAKKLCGPQQVVVVNVVDEGLPGFLETSSVATIGSSEHEKEIKKVAEKRLREWISSIDPGEENLEAVILVGKPASQVICDYAAERGFDVIVIGNQGKGALRRLVLGSTVQQVQRLSPCPVLAVKDPANWVSDEG